VSITKTVPSKRSNMIATSRAQTCAPYWRLYTPASALFLWVCLWLNLNSGFWNIRAPHSLDECQLLGRAILPFAVLPVAGALVLSRRKLDLPSLGPSRLLMICGLLAAIASVDSPRPAQSLYWSMTFLATIATAWTFVNTRIPVASAREMLQVTWTIMFVVAAIIAYMARGSVFGNAPSAYAVNIDLNELSISSGVARWAAVPSLVCILKAYHTRRPALMAFFLAAAGAAFFIVYRMQSRGAVFGAISALLFALVTSSRLRRYALPFAVFTVMVATLLETPAVLSDRVSEYLMRGQTEAEFRSMTGRTRAYKNGLAAFWDAPLLGRGQWADRMVIGEHVHNSYLQALLNAGILGGIPYVASWVVGWVLFFRLQKRRHLLRPEDRLSLLEAGTVMMFFTVRSVPETTTASFAVDLLVMAAIYVYFETLAVSTARRLFRQSARIQVRAGTQKNRFCPQMVGRATLVPNASRE
jgi:O-antigen ligase